MWTKQAEEEAIFLAQKSGLDGRQEFAARLEGFISQVLKVCVWEICISDEIRSTSLYYS